MKTKNKLIVVAAAFVVGTALGGVPSVQAHTTGIHDNCTNLNKKWPHGVGTRSAVDKTRSGASGVRNFHRNDTAYWAAERHNSTLDRDNDRIACEKR